MVGVLHVTQTLAHIMFVGQKDLLHLSWKGVEGDVNILGVSDFLELDVRNFLVINHSWIVSWDVPWQFGEVGSHF